MKHNGNRAASSALRSNVIPFPGAPRAHAAAARDPAGAIATTGAELNARLLMLLAICTGAAVSTLLIVHVLHG